LGSLTAPGTLRTIKVSLWGKKWKTGVAFEGKRGTKSRTSFQEGAKGLFGEDGGLKKGEMGGESHR